LQLDFFYCPGTGSQGNYIQKQPFLTSPAREAGRKLLIEFSVNPARRVYRVNVKMITITTLLRIFQEIAHYFRFGDV